MSCQTVNVCGVCQRYPCVYVACLDGDGSDITGDYFLLPGTTVWNLNADREEADRVRTCQTGGKRVKFCPDDVDWTLEVTSVLCPDPAKWIYRYLLDGKAVDPSDTVCRAFFATWLSPEAAVAAYPPAAAGDINPYNGPITYAAIEAADIDDGVIVVASVTPGGFGIDASSTSPAQTTFTLEIAEGPFLPAATPFTCA